MRSNSIGAESTFYHSRAFSSSINKLLPINNNSTLYYSLNDPDHVDHNVIDDSNDNVIQKINRKMNNEVRYNALSIYDNYSNEIKSEIEREKSRTSRKHDKCDGKNLCENKVQVKRDHSMPPIRYHTRYYVEDNIQKEQSIVATKHSVDGGLDFEDNTFDCSITDMTDSVITNVSVTPPPVRMIHEYANKQAIIRPLAFRPVPSDRAKPVSESSPTKPPMAMKAKVGQVRRTSPPPVPPHANRVPLKTSLVRVQSLKSGDSSGYYSSRTVGTVNGNTSSTDISPIFDDPGSIVDDIATTADIYVNTKDFIDDYHLGDGDLQDIFNTKTSFEWEISSERERSSLLESALSKSNTKLLSVESQINELKVRLSQKTSEVSNAKENLALCKRSLDRQSQKTHILEKSIQAIKFDQSCKEKIMKDKTTQTNVYNGDNSVNNLLEQFDDERRIWLDEKLKVLTYQKQIETNFQKLLIKSRHLESQILKLKAQQKDGRSQHSYPSNHSDDHEKLSLNSGDSSGKNYISNINRIDHQTEQQASL